MTDAPVITVQEVLEKLREKLTEATDALQDMYEHKREQKRFRSQLSIYLTAADSVLDVMSAQGKRYAKQKHVNKLAEFKKWFQKQENLYRLPDGTDKTWVYLRAARNSTVHVEQVNPNHLSRVGITTRIHISEAIRVTEHHEDGTVTVIDAPPEPPPPQEPDEIRIEKNLWAFQPVTDMRSGKRIEPPPNDDVVTICNAHIKKLRLLIRRCKWKLSTLTPAQNLVNP